MSLVAKSISNIPKLESPDFRVWLERALKDHDPNLTSGADPGHTHTFGGAPNLHAPDHESGGGDPIGHDNLTGFVGNEHIDHSGISVTGGGILSGGGAITSSQVITLANADIDHDQTTNYVASEHIDWTNTTEDFLTTGTLGAGDGTLTSIGVEDGSHNLPSIYFTNARQTGFYLSGSAGNRELNVTLEGVRHTYFHEGGIKLKDSTSAYFGRLAFSGTRMTTDRQLTLDLSDDSNIFKIAGDITVELDSVVNQDLTTDASPTFAGLTLDMTQDYVYSARGSSSLAVQSQTQATPYALELFNKDGDGTDGTYVSLFGIGTPASIDPRERLIIAYVAGNTDYEIYTETLNGTVRPLSIYTGTNTTQCVFNIDNSIDMSGALAVTGTVSGATGSTFGNLTLADGSITDSSGAITFVNENLSTTGTLSCGELTLNFGRVYKFSGAVRLEIQSQTSGVGNLMHLLTKDGDGTDDITFGLIATGAPGNFNPFEALYIRYDTGDSRYEIYSDSHSTGDPVTSWPIHIFADGANDTQLVLTNDNNVAMSGALGVTGAISGASLTVTGTVQGEQITSTDDMTMAGLFTNTPAAGDTTIVSMAGDTNARTYAGADETSYSFLRTLTGSSTNMDSMAMTRNTLTYDYDYTGVAGGSAGSHDVMRGAFYTIAYTGDITPSSVFFNQNGYFSTRGMQCYNDFFPGTVTDPALGSLHFFNAGGYFESLNRGDYDFDGAGTHTIHTYGGYFLARENVTITAGAPVFNYYGGYFDATGSADGTSTSYGGYFTGTGSDTNYGIYVAAGSTSLLDTTIGDGTNQTAFAADGLQTMAGTARVMISIDLEPVLATRPSANPPGESTEDSFSTHDFNPTTDESVFFHLELPHNYAAAGTIHVHFDFFVDTAPAAAKSVVWGVEYKKQSIGDNFDFGAGTTTAYTQTSVTTGTPANDKKTHQSSEISLTTTGFVPGDYLLLRLFRDADGTGGTDDFAADARVIDYHIEYLSDKLGEAT